MGFVIIGVPYPLLSGCVLYQPFRFSAGNGEIASVPLATFDGRLGAYFCGRPLVHDIPDPWVLDVEVVHVADHLGANGCEGEWKFVFLHRICY